MKDNRESLLIKNYIFNYLNSLTPDVTYYCKNNEFTYLFFSEKNYIFSLNKDFIESIYFSNVHIEWNEEQHFPIVKKDSFEKLDSKDLISYVNGNITSSTKLKDLLKIKG
jgi:hypothetical protein